MTEDMEGAPAPRWCVLTMSGGRTLSVARSLAKAGFEVWTPTAIENRRRPRSTKMFDREVPVVPTFVFARADRMEDLQHITTLDVSPHPQFSVFRWGDRVPLIADSEIVGLRAEELRLKAERDENRRQAELAAMLEAERQDRIRTQHQRAELKAAITAERKRMRHKLVPGAFVQVSEGPFAGRVGVVERGDDRAAWLNFGGMMLAKIETWMLPQNAVNALQPA